MSAKPDEVEESSEYTESSSEESTEYSEDKGVSKSKYIIATATGEPSR